MPERPEVTVVIPTRDRWPLLGGTLASALAQRDVELEVIVVDDGSSDETPARLATHPDGRVRTFRHDPNRGVAQARNRGIAEARGEWLAFLDDDDTWSPLKLRTQLDAVRRWGAGFAYGSAVHFDEHGTIIGIETAPEPEELAPWLLTKRNAIPAGCSNVMARTDLVRRLGGFDEKLFHLADWDLWVRLIEAAPPVACPEVLVGYLKHSANMLTTLDRDIFGEFAYLSAKHEAASRARGLRFNGVDLARWVASGHRRAGRRRLAARAYLYGALAYRAPIDVLRAVNVLLNPRATGPGGAAAPAGFDAPPWLHLPAEQPQSVRSATGERASG
jgi:glycosyltransferase involved in cell wall biosynthesis